MSHPALSCEQAVESIRFHMEGELGAEETQVLQQHLNGCANCRKEFATRKQVLGLLGKTYGQRRISPEFDKNANQRLKVAMTDTGKQAIAESVRDDEEAMLAAVGDKDFGDEKRPIAGMLASAPWWLVSVTLHGLVIMLAGLISMAIELPKGDEPMITVTELSARPPIEQITKKPENADNALHSKHETPPTDPTSKEMSHVIVPPELLAQAELGDHFETINPDRPDTQSAFGNPDAQMFHSNTGNDEEAGGGGNQGATLDDAIGVGGASSPGTGGGWGGGNGTGIGVGNGSGRGSFGNRNGGGRRLMVMRHGGSKATEGAVDRALEWLARKQEADGSWNVAKTEGNTECLTCDPGVTGLAVLAFLGAGHTEKVGKYKENVRKGVAWIISQQRADGAIGTDKRWTEHHGGFGYHHSICGMALVEAAAMSRNAETMKAAQLSVDYTCNLYQHGEGSDKLGWRYAPKAAVGDMSVSGWFIMQLKSAKVAGLRIDPFSFEGALKFMASRESDPAQVQKENDGYDTGRHRYGYTDKTPMVNTTSIGVLCQLFCGTKPDELRGAASWLLRTNPPEWKADLGVANAGGWPMYYTYYTTLLMFQMGGDHWKKWNEGMKKMLLDHQRKDGDFDGSWDPLSPWEKKAGRAYTTALGCLSLEVYYRYMKLDGGH
ncbi:MAG TPA: zf-HC2 domain-containing protein [Planctomycetota bacterium]|nr:zf-HC2 domain-containing protein [Planctomycetota bacterium]